MSGTAVRSAMCAGLGDPSHPTRVRRPDEGIDVERPPRPGISRRRTSVGVGLVLALPLTAGCSATEDPPRRAEPAPAQEEQRPPPGEIEYLTEGSAADEYRAAVAEIGQPLPAGVGYPP